MTHTALHSDTNAAAILLQFTVTNAPYQVGGCKCPARHLYQTQKQELPFFSRCVERTLEGIFCGRGPHQHPANATMASKQKPTANMIDSNGTRLFLSVPDPPHECPVSLTPFPISYVFMFLFLLVCRCRAWRVQLAVARQRRPLATHHVHCCLFTRPLAPYTGLNAERVLANVTPDTTPAAPS